MDDIIKSMDKISDFIEDVKEGKIRGEYENTRISDNVYLEVSVGSFQYGRVLIRVWVEEKDIQNEEGLFYKRLYNIDQKYKMIHQDIKECIEKHNETDVPNHFEFQIKNPQRSDASITPDGLDSDHTVAFEGFVRLRDDVTMAEALMTNRRDGMTRTEVEDFKDNL